MLCFLQQSHQAAAHVTKVTGSRDHWGDKSVGFSLRPGTPKINATECVEQSKTEGSQIVSASYDRRKNDNDVCREKFRASAFAVPQRRGISIRSLVQDGRHVCAEFSDGSTPVITILWSADGIGSIVRALALDAVTPAQQSRFGQLIPPP
jgi:hypothetical protein